MVLYILIGRRWHHNVNDAVPLFVIKLCANVLACMPDFLQKRLVEMNVNISNELNFSAVYRSINCIGLLAKFTWLCTRPNVVYTWINSRRMKFIPLLKMPTVADQEHVNNVKSVLLFTQVTIPLMSSRITCSQVKSSLHSLFLCLYSLNSSVEKNIFFSSGDSTARKDLVPTLPVNIYDNDHCKVIHPSSCLHVFGHPRNSTNYQNTNSWLLEGMIGVFYWKMNVALLF